jgi:alpha-mannosidase
MDGCEQTFVSSLLDKIDRLRDLSQVNVLAGWGIGAVADLPTPPCRVPLRGGELIEGSQIIEVPLAGTRLGGESVGVPLVGTLLNGNLASLNEKGFIAWEGGSQEIWLGQRLVLPTHVQDYPVAGLVCRLALTWWAELAQVFVNGVLVQEGDLFDHSARIVLTPAVVPGTAVEVWLRLVSPGHDRGALMRSRLIYESLNPTFPEPGWLADELAVMVKQIAALHPARLEEVGSTIDRIDYDLLTQDSHQFIQHVLEIKQQVKLVIDRYTLIGHPQGAPIQDKDNSQLPTPISHLPSPISLLGHAHLDMAWLWEVAETWQVAERTFCSALNLQQDYPQLSFCHSTPALYEWIEVNKPELFDRICQQIKVGTWEVVGGMWIEPDLNLISGESIARQIIYGQRYNQAKFGERTRVDWLPDTFGFCWQLPQLLLQGGIDYFVTQKFQWNDTTKFPHQLFWWEAPDGSRVLSLMSSAIGEGIDPLKMIDYACGWQTSTGIDESLWLFGVGDHGGGPTRDMLELADRWSKSDVFPDLEFTTAVKYLDKLASRADIQNLPVWQDDLYLEFHRGCFTTHADQKRSNRQCEDLLYQAELWSTLASIITQQSYSDELKLQLETAWKQTLFNQFHDIIPGTAIEPVYVTANEGWANVEGVTTQIIGDALSQISDRISLPTPPIPGAIPIVIFNALNWSRTEVVKYPLAYQEEVGFRGWRVFDADGKAIPTQSSAEHILFLATDLPSVGYKLFWLAPITPLPGGVPEGGGGLTTSAATQTETQASSDFIFKNQFVRVEIDRETGDITSIWDEINQCEVLSGSGNQLQAFKDSDQYWDAWNIDPQYAEHQLPPSQLRSIEWIETGAIRQRLRVVRVLAGCEFSQDYILDAHASILQIRTSVDWQTRHVLIKANFPLNLTADKSTAEMACGAIARTTKPQTAAEKAKWELPMHRWVDLTDNAGEYGVSLLNDCKYGYDAGTDYLRLTLLRGTEWPDPVADRGYHEFTCAIYPHAGTWQAAQTVRRGYELNSPLQVFQLSSNDLAVSSDAHLSPIGSLLNLQAENLILMAFKSSDNSAQPWVLRCYECHGVAGEIDLGGELGLEIDREVNLFDEPQGEKLDLSVKPWQIRSFGVK